MADNIGSLGAPGIAAFASSTFGNIREPRFAQEPPVAYRKTRITNGGGAAMNLAAWSVVGAAGLATEAAGVSNALGILPYPVSIAAGQSADVELIVQGSFDYQALVWDASFGTDAEKLAAFDNRPSPINIILGTHAFTSDGVLAASGL